MCKKLNISNEQVKLKQIGKNTVNYLTHILPIKTVQEMERLLKLLICGSYRINSKPIPFPPGRMIA